MSNRPSTQLIVAAVLVAIVSYGFIQGNPPPAASQMLQDDRFVYLLQGSSVLKFQKSDLKPAANELFLQDFVMEPQTKDVDEFRVVNRDVNEALLQFFNKEQISCSISPEVRGKVSLNVKKAPFKDTLNAILRQVNATYLVNAGVFMIVPAFPAASNTPADKYPHFADPGWLPGSRGNADTPTADNQMVMDAESLYLMKGNTLYKIQKSNMKVVATEVVFLHPGGRG